MTYDASRPIKECPICGGNSNQREDFSTDDLEVDCERCGDFALTRHARLTYVGHLDDKQRGIASGLIRETQGDKRPTLTMDFFKSMGRPRH